jgi:hypothetical protein
VRSDPLYVSPLRCGEGEARPEQVEALETRYREAPRDSHQPGHPSQLPRPTCVEALHWGESQYTTKLHLQGSYIGRDAPDHTIYGFNSTIQETQHAL